MQLEQCFGVNSKYLYPISVAQKKIQTQKVQIQRRAGVDIEIKTQNPKRITLYTRQIDNWKIKT